MPAAYLPNASANSRKALSLVGRCRQIARIFKLLAETKDIAIGVRNLEFREAIRHPLAPPCHDASIMKLSEHFAKLDALAPKVNVPIILPGFRALRW